MNAETTLENRLAAVLRYHQTSKHRPDRYAPGPHGLDSVSYTHLDVYKRQSTRTLEEPSIKHLIISGKIYADSLKTKRNLNA